MPIARRITKSSSLGAKLTFTIETEELPTSICQVSYCIFGEGSSVNNVDKKLHFRKYQIFFFPYLVKISKEIAAIFILEFSLIMAILLSVPFHN